MTPDFVHVDFRKWPDTPHWQYHMLPLGEDEHGRWLWTPPGFSARRGSEPPVTFDELCVKLISHGWWAAMWSLDLRKSGTPELYVDIIAPAEWHPSRVRMVDLDLDIKRSAGGFASLVDEDEFEEHRVALNYPPELIEGARAAAAEVFDAVCSAREPFGQAGPRWMAAALARHAGSEG